METLSPPPSDLTLAAARFAALGSEQRLHVMRTLVRAGPKGLTIGALGERSTITGSTLTHHVKLLVAAGLVQQQKQGRNIICAAVAHAAINEMSQFLLTECCADADAPCPDHSHLQKAPDVTRSSSPR
jgi:ArsR family transcriptional regulator, arsenate/arsenite/antimonite-responsive transcriptional repressor